jgi:hypothetical protein
VIEPEQVEHAMERQEAQLDPERVAGRAGLTPRQTGGNHDVAQIRLGPGRERKDIGYIVVPEILAIEGSNAGIRHQSNPDLRAAPNGRHALEPARKAPDPGRAAAAISHDHAQL